MALRNTQYDTIMREYDRKQLYNRHLYEEHRADAYKAVPRLSAIDDEIASLSLNQARAALTGGTKPTADLHGAITTLAQERIDQLTSHGYPADYLEMHYTCPLCQDTGYIEGKKCTCFRKASVELLYTQSNVKEILQKENFEHFSFDYYSDRIVNEATGQTALETAKDAVRKSKEFIQRFDDSFQNLFFYGNTGVGKTFLSHCIAKDLIDSSHCVIYFSSFDLFDQLAKNTFHRDYTKDESTDYIFDCDLLIIDDLGTELTNSFVSSQLFLCINERIARKKATIISTNLDLDKFNDTYSERVFSRIASNYTMIKLIGDDIRIQKRLLGGK
ncbi:MAG: ATP-binding protein [Lachnospiraceae bacterium]|nr:ATP-binding protein [Lachnospiraceae bacterium]